MRVPVPASMRSRLDAREPEVEARDASTIALVRPGDGAAAAGVETFLLQRASTMAFAPGMSVFPGGGVQTSDSEDLPAVGPSWETWADRLGCGPDQARGLVVAAIRETFEESGILLAGPDADHVLESTDRPDLVEARRALEAHELTLSDLLADQGLLLRTDLVAAWSRWITPAFEPRRYDTRFFVALVPTGQHVGHLTGEAERAAWTPLAQVVDDLRAGRTRMLPPTSVTCQELVGVDPSDLLRVADQRIIRPIEPRAVQVDGEWFLDNDSDVPPLEGGPVVETTGE